MTRGLGFYVLLGAWLIGAKMIAERIAHGLVTTHCSLRATNGTGEMRSYKMGPSMRKAGLVLMAVLGSSPTALAAGDSSAGQTVFATHCVACHSTQPGKNEVGPSLAGIVGSKSASVPGYDFSPAMKDANITGTMPISTNTSQTRPASFRGPGCSSISPATPIGRMSSPTSTR